MAAGIQVLVLGMCEDVRRDSRVGAGQARRCHGACKFLVVGNCMLSTFSNAIVDVIERQSDSMLRRSQWSM